MLFILLDNLSTLRDKARPIFIINMGINYISCWVILQSVATYLAYLYNNMKGTRILSVS
jgi:hypothetical protein